MDPAAFRQHFAVEPPDVARGMRLAAIRFAVRDMAAARAALGAANAAERMGKLIVGPQAAHGATLVFEAYVATRRHNLFQIPNAKLADFPKSPSVFGEVRSP